MILKSKECHSPAEVPEGHHFAIIVYDKLNHDDGWGGTTDTKISQHYVTTNRQDWLDDIRSLEVKEEKAYIFYEQPKYVAFEVKKKAKVAVAVAVSVDDD
jgi:hypothetical protein